MSLYVLKFSQFYTALMFLIGCLNNAEAAEHWIDEAVLHDGRIVDVDRSVTYNYGRGELSNAFTKWPNEYSFKARNPDTGKLIKWSGEKDFNPILLDFSNQVAYLVVVANSVFSNIKQYGCPEIPYIFFLYDEKSNSWKQISAKEFPLQLLKANLSFRYNGNWMKNGNRQSKDDIQRHNGSDKGSTGKFIAQVIPTDFESWQSKYKNEYRVNHYHDGCRDTVPSNEDPSHPQSKGQPYQIVALEILETKIYEPEWVIKGNAEIQGRDWSAISWDVERQKSCESLIRRVGDDSEKPELRGWLLFVNDPTGSKKARQTGDFYCNADAIWFVDYAGDKDVAILTKFTVSGDYIYRIGFKKPDTPSYYLGGILQSTFKEKNGDLYFEWWNTNQSGWDRHIKRSMKVKLHEPKG